MESDKKRKLKNTKKRAAFLLIRIGMALCLLFILFFTKRLDLGVFARLDWIVLITAAPFYLLAFLAGIYRWWFLVRAVNLPLCFWDTTRLAMTGIWVSSVVPGGSLFAGDAARTALFAAENTKRRYAALTSVLTDRLLGMLAIFTFAAIGFMMNPSLLAKSRWLQVIGIVLVAIILVILSVVLFAISQKTHTYIFSSKLFKKIPGHRVIFKVLDAFYLFRNHRMTLIKAHLVSYLGHGSMILAIFFLSRGIGIQLASISDYLFAISIGIISAMIPISGPAGVGAGNVGFSVSFALVNSNYGAELALLWQVSFILVSQIGLPFFLIGRRKRTLSSTLNVSLSES